MQLPADHFYAKRSDLIGISDFGHCRWFSTYADFLGGFGQISILDKPQTDEHFMVSKDHGISSICVFNFHEQCPVGIDVVEQWGRLGVLREIGFGQHHGLSVG